MGSRAIAVLARSAEVAARRFGVADGSTGAVYTRTGRSFFDDTDGLVAGLREAAEPLFDSLATDWLALDCELLPWSAKAGGLIRDQYASVAAAGLSSLPAASALLEQAAARGQEVGDLLTRIQDREADLRRYRAAYGSYVRPVDAPITVAPFQILAVEGRALALTESHEWHLAELAKLEGDLITPTRHRFVDLTSAEQRAEAVRWWLDLTAAGGEGMVVKPAHLPERPMQPGLKVRGREYLRIIYGPDYTGSLDTLRNRPLGRKRHLAEREHGLGLEALTTFVDRGPLWKVHQSVFALLALESEPVDPRL